MKDAAQHESASQGHVDNKVITFRNNQRLKQILGPSDAHVTQIEMALGITLTPNGNHIRLKGTTSAIKRGEHLLQSLYHSPQSDIVREDIEAALKFLPAAIDEEREQSELDGDKPHLYALSTRKKNITARSPTQAAYLRAMAKATIVFAAGPAGTGKTYLAVAQAVKSLEAGDVKRIVLCRPAIEAGEQLGFLPGDMKEKVDPYFRPLYDSLNDLMGSQRVEKLITMGQIEIAPLAYMRGRTLSDAFIILDEAQNCNHLQMKMLLTRLGEGTRMVICGDPSQVDLLRGTPSGLAEAISLLTSIDGIDIIHFHENDIVRHPLVGAIIRAYQKQGTS